jgi:putative endonuclease
MYIVYAIKSKISNRVYIGFTGNIEKRLEYHNSGYVKSTKKDRPWELIARERYDKRNDARWKERQLKKSKGGRLRWMKTNKCVS